MAVEIERKFLVTNHDWKTGRGTLYRQGYLNSHKDRTVRVRIVGKRATLTVKGSTTGATRQEFEYSIPLEEATYMLHHLCEQPILEKTRHLIEVEGVTFEIDEFLGENKGLVVAEVELESEDQPFVKPDWLGQEVTHDPRYFNSNLIRHPYQNWQSTEPPGTV